MTALGWPRRAPRLRLRGRWAAVRPDLLPLEIRALPAVFTVNSFADGIAIHPGDGTAHTATGSITLRSAIMEANAEGGPSTIILPAGSYTLSIPGANEDAAATGDLDILAPITVQGAGPATTTITGDGSDRIFDVRTLQNVTLENLTLTGGRADVGGAIRSAFSSVLELDNVVLTNNQSTGNGGAIAVIAASTHGQLTLNDVLLQNNTAGGLGGAISMDGLTVVANGVTIANNTAIGGGGGVAIMDTQHIGLAGAQVDDTTLYGNSTPAHGGGGLILAGIVQANDSTIAFNSASIGGGIDGSVGGGNDIVAKNSASTGPDISGSVSSQGFNLVGNGSGATGTFAASDRIGTAAAPLDPLLSSLVVHGGNLPVLIPGPGSPALGVGSSFTPTDERGVIRPTTGDDIGAVQIQAFAITAPTTVQHAAGGTAFGPLTATITEGGLPLPGVAVTFTAPSSGPSGTFAGSTTVQTNASGVATAPTFTANFQTGSYLVQARASANLFTGVPLTNDPARTDSLQVTTVPQVVQPGVPFQIVVTALTPGGVRDTGYTGTVSFSTDAAAGATLPIPTAFSLSDGGQKAFEGLATGLGTHTIHVTDANGPVGQVNFTVQTDSFSVTATPPTQAGVPFQLTVTALKPDGTRDAGYVGAVSFTADEAALASLPGTTDFGSADAGQKTFMVTLGALGSHTITVTDPAGPVGHVTVSVTPVMNRFAITAPASVDEGAPFSITITAENPQSAPLTSFTGPVTLTSDDPRAVLPTGIVFAASDNGVKTITGLSLRPIGPRTITVTAPDGTTGSVSVGVVNLGPSSLELSTNPGSVPEGSSTTLSGTFTNPDPLDTHTVSINWGDNSTPTVLHLSAGVFHFQTDHVYNHEPLAGSAAYPINVTVTDAAGGTTTGAAQETVTNVPPTLAAGSGFAAGDAGGPFGQKITFTDPGADTWTASADYGDGTGSHPVPISGHTLTLDHVYQTEGSYVVNLTLQDGEGGSDSLTEKAIVFLPGTTGIRLVVIPPGGTASLSVPGGTVTLSNLGGTTPAILLFGDVNPNVLDGLNGSPTNDPTKLVSAFDIRVLSAGPDSVLTATLSYPNGVPGADPSVQYYDKVAAQFADVEGSTKVVNSFVVDKAGHTVTFILGSTSTPTVADLGGTVFTLSVPAPTPTPSTQSTASTGTSPFQLASAAPSSPAVAALASIDTGTGIAAPIPTTGLVSSSTLTVAVSAAEGLVRGGGDEPLSGRLVNTQTLSTVIETAVEITDFLKEAFRMWLDQPAPMEAPAAIVPPPDMFNQVQLRPTAEEPAVCRPAEVDPKAVAFDALAVPPVKDVVVAHAESRPWWLAAAPERSADDEPIPLPTEQQPTTADRAAAAVMAVWLGGNALAAFAPEPRLDDEEEWPRESDDQDEE